MLCPLPVITAVLIKSYWKQGPTVNFISKATIKAILMLPDVIFFDLDDTLIDHGTAARSALSKLQEEYEVLGAMELDELEMLWQKDFQKYWELLILNRITIQENWAARFRNLFETVGHSIGGDELGKLVSDYGELYISGTSAIPGAAEILKKAREHGVTVSVITNNIAEMQYRKVKHCGLDGYIDSMTISQDYGIMKPDPEIFRIAMRKTGTLPEKSLMVGDSLDSDILGAIGVGIKPVWFNRFGIENGAAEVEVPILDGYQPTDRAWDSMISAFSGH